MMQVIISIKIIFEIKLFHSKFYVDINNTLNVNETNKHQ